MSDISTVCYCGCEQPLLDCINLRQGKRGVPSFTWNLSAQGLTQADQQRIADALDRANLGYTLTPNNTNIAVTQPTTLDKNTILLHTLYPVTPNGSNLADNFPDEAFWDPRPLQNGPTPNVSDLTGSDLLGLIQGFAKTLQPVASVEKRRDNIKMVLTKFRQEVPDGQVDLLIKDRTALKRVAFFRILAHLSLFNAETVAQNLNNSPTPMSPFLATMAQSSALPFETLLQQHIKHGFLIDWVDNSFVFWLGPSKNLPDNPTPSAILSPWGGSALNQFDLELDLPLYRQLVAWTAGATNDLFRFLIDGRRLSCYSDPANHWLYDWLIWTEINNLTHAIMRSKDSFVRLELFLRLAYNIVSRMTTPQEGTQNIRDLPFEKKSKIMKCLLCQIPKPLQLHLWEKWQELANRVADEIVGEILPAFKPNDLRQPILVAGKKLTRGKYVSHLVEALRHSTHGFDSQRSDKTILFTHTGKITDELPYLAFFWWLGILARPEWVFRQ
ncbi:hypothetical protein [Sulfobacillus thermosulfidooxidans]|uniref:hypothetical protein n=1 Tax=Sulfobacillus thermosulfidooxidans TaxID=28034 RepID=UPI00031F02C3|nr:hypothetical protein [Sulfobacillus thermosulfidooxidans]